LVNARLASGTRRLNYNNTDNFARSQNSFWRAIVDTQLNEQWSLRNEAYVATQDLNWRNTESYNWNPVTRLVDRASFLLIYRNDFQWCDRIELTWGATVAGRANKPVVGALYDDNDQLRNTGQPNVPPSPTPASVPLTGFD